MKNRKKITSHFWLFLGDLRHFVSKWTVAPLATLTLVCGLAMGSCKTIQYIPVETGTTVHIKDSVALHIKDSVRVIEKSVYRDYTGLLDTLSISSSKASMRAWADTSRNMIAGELKTEPIEEKTKIVYKDRVEYRDSLVYKEVPVPVEVEKEVKIVPKFWRVTGVIGIISILTLLGFVGFKIWKLKGEGFIFLFKKLKVK